MKVVLLLVFLIGLGFGFVSVKDSLLSGYENCAALVQATTEKSDIEIHPLIAYNIFCSVEERELLMKY